MRKTPHFADTQIEMAHGAGGIASRRLVEGLIGSYLSNPILQTFADAATISINGSNVATTADGFVVKPLRFPGGSIGELAVNGTLNDLAVSAAKPIALMATLILEAGLPTSTLESEIEAMAIAARKAGVCIVGGDTKVVEHGKADGMYVSTFGIGLVDARVTIDPAIDSARRPDSALRTDRRPWDYDPARAWRARSASRSRLGYATGLAFCQRADRSRARRPCGGCATQRAAA